MEKIQGLKFQSLQEEDLKKIKGGRWRIDTMTYPNGDTHAIAYRTNIFGTIQEWGSPIGD